MRPKPQILQSHIDPKTRIALEVLAAPGVYAVTYDGEPINLRNVHTLIDQHIKYKKCCFSTSGHAKLLANKLNQLFKTQNFGVTSYTAGQSLKLSKR